MIHRFFFSIIDTTPIKDIFFQVVATKSFCLVILSGWFYFGGLVFFSRYGSMRPFLQRACTKQSSARMHIRVCCIRNASSLSSITIKHKDPPAGRRNDVTEAFIYYSYVSMHRSCYSILEKMRLGMFWKALKKCWHWVIGRKVWAAPLSSAGWGRKLTFRAVAAPAASAVLELSVG